MKKLIFILFALFSFILANAHEGCGNSAQKEQPEIVDEEPIFVVVEKMPEFPGGRDSLNQFITKNLRCPQLYSETFFQGKVIVEFIVEKDGSLTNIKIIREFDPLLDAEAIRVVSIMPKWISGEQNGQKVRVKMVLPIAFRF